MKRGFWTTREGGDGHYQSIFASPLLPELIARPHRDGDGNLDQARLHLGVKWGGSHDRFLVSSVELHTRTRMERWVEREKVGVEGPSSTATSRSSFAATMLPPPLRATREWRERDSSQVLFSCRISPSSPF